MNSKDLEEKTRTAIDAYNDYVDIDREVLADDLFIRTFVEKTITAKENLKNMLRKHSDWDEKEECKKQISKNIKNDKIFHIFDIF